MERSFLIQHVLTWKRFLLNYVTRDEVDVFKHGNTGLSQARDALAQYEEKIPLYGFVQHRRRKALFKYIPEGTSRLLQGI